MLGKIIDGRYELIREIGCGGMGTVYEARHTTLDKKTALKLLNPQWRGETSVRAQMINEAKAAARIRHDNVVDVVHVGETREGDVYIVMELLEGTDLEQLIPSEGFLELERARRILVHIAAGLAAAHKKKVVHRDVKPANCFIEKLEGNECEVRERVKVLDFGIAKITEGGHETARLAGSTRPWGTRRYIAPEVVDGDPSSFASDVYSFGVLAYRTLTGCYPYSGGNSELTAPQDHRSDLPADLQDLLTSTLQRRPEDRPKSMVEVHEALKHRRRMRQASDVPTPSTTASALQATPVTSPTTNPVDAPVVSATRRPRFGTQALRWGGLVGAMALIPVIFDLRRVRGLGGDHKPIVMVNSVETDPASDDETTPVVAEPPKSPPPEESPLEEPISEIDADEPEIEPTSAPRARGPRRQRSMKTEIPPEPPESKPPPRRWSLDDLVVRHEGDRVQVERPKITRLMKPAMECMTTPSPLERRLRVEFVISSSTMTSISIAGSLGTPRDCISKALNVTNTNDLPPGKYEIKIRVPAKTT